MLTPKPTPMPLHPLNALHWMSASAAVSVGVEAKPEPRNPCPCPCCCWRWEYRRGLLGLMPVSLAPTRICCKFWNCPRGFARRAVGAGAGGLAGLQPRHGLCAGLGYPCLGQHPIAPSCPVLPPCWAFLLALLCWPCCTRRAGLGCWRWPAGRAAGHSCWRWASGHGQVTKCKTRGHRQ